MGKKKLGLFILLLFVLGCQSSLLKDFSSLQLGIEKNDVLETMGSPRATTRYHGKDRWMYRFYDDGIRFEKEVHFLDGIAIYVGDSIEPELTKIAVDKDALNLKLDLQLAEAAEKNRAQAKANALEDAKHKQTEIHYLPEFEAVH